MKSDQYETQGKQLLDSRRYSEAWQYETEALKIYPGNSLAYVDRGMALFYMNRMKDAIADFTNALKYDPVNQGAYAGRAAAYAKLGDTKNMAADRLKAAQLMAIPLKAQHQLELAKINQQILANRTDEVYLIHRAQKYYEMADFNQCIKDATAAIGMNRYNEDAYEVRGRAYEILGQTDLYAADNAQYKHLCGKDIYQHWADRGLTSSWENIANSNARHAAAERAGHPIINEPAGWKVP